MVIGKFNKLQKQKEAKLRGEKYDQWDHIRRLGKAKAQPLLKNPFKRTDTDLLLSQVDQRRVLSHQLSREGFDPPIPKKHEDKCAICQCDSDIVLEIESLYQAYVNPTQISRHLKKEYKFEITAESIRRHCVTFSLDKQRVQNHDAILDALVERGMIALARKQGTVDVKSLISVIKMRMEKSGEIGKTTSTVNVGINIPITKADRMKSLEVGLGQFGIDPQIEVEVETPKED